jgi:hypothetical protein
VELHEVREAAKHTGLILNLETSPPAANPLRHLLNILAIIYD